MYHRIKHRAWKRTEKELGTKPLQTLLHIKVFIYSSLHISKSTEITINEKCALTHTHISLIHVAVDFPCTLQIPIWKIKSSGFTDYFASSNVLSLALIVTLIQTCLIMRANNIYIPQQLLISICNPPQTRPHFKRLQEFCLCTAVYFEFGVKECLHVALLPKAKVQLD